MINYRSRQSPNGGRPINSLIMISNHLGQRTSLESLRQFLVSSKLENLKLRWPLQLKNPSRRFHFRNSNQSFLKRFFKERLSFWVENYQIINFDIDYRLDRLWIINWLVWKLMKFVRCIVNLPKWVPLLILKFQKALCLKSKIWNLNHNCTSSNGYSPCSEELQNWKDTNSFNWFVQAMRWL